MDFILFMEKMHYNIVVKGKVQGVWFRKFTKDKADEFGIIGFVQNKFDGLVYIEAEGKKEVLKEFIAWLYQGSPSAKVREVVYDIGEFQNYTNFEIRRTTT